MAGKLQYKRGDLMRENGYTIGIEGGGGGKEDSTFRVVIDLGISPPFCYYSFFLM